MKGQIQLTQSRKDKSSGVTPLGVKHYFKAAVIKAMWHWCRDRQTNGTEQNPNRLADICHLIFASLFHFMWVWFFFFFFFLCPLSVLVWLRLQSLSASSPDLLVTASSLFLRLWLGFAMVTWQAFPGEGRSHVPEHLFYFTEHDQEWHQSRADHCLEVLGFFKQKKKQKQKQESFPPPLK